MKRSLKLPSRDIHYRDPGAPPTFLRAIERLEWKGSMRSSFGMLWTTKEQPKIYLFELHYRKIMAIRMSGVSRRCLFGTGAVLVGCQTATSCLACTKKTDQCPYRQALSDNLILNRAD